MDYPESYAEHVEEPYRRRGQWYPMEAYNRSMDQTLRKPGRSVEERLGGMDLMAIDTSVLYPTSG